MWIVNTGYNVIVYDRRPVLIENGRGETWLDDDKCLILYYLKPKYFTWLDIYEPVWKRFILQDWINL